MRITFPRILFTSLLGLGLAACGTTGVQHQAQSADLEAQPLGQETAAQPEYVTVTGSRIRQKVDPETGQAVSGSVALTTFDRDEVDSTGKRNLADALYLLDPRFR